MEYSMSENKCCGDCKNFKDEDADGYGWCLLQQEETKCSFSYPCHEPLNNGWIEITPDNEDSIPDNNRVIITDGQSFKNVTEWHLGIGTMAKHGGYYYYVLPELE